VIDDAVAAASTRRGTDPVEAASGGGPNTTTNAADSPSPQATVKSPIGAETAGGAHVQPEVLPPGDAARAAKAASVGPKVPVQAGEVTTYKDFDSRSPKGDDLFGHELWQHANIKAHGLATRRFSTGVSQDNPVIALDRDTHNKVTSAQRALDPARQTPIDNINSNAEILRRLNAAPPEVIELLRQKAIDHARKQGY
jgi:hypothetical protein